MSYKTKGLSNSWEYFLWISTDAWWDSWVSFYESELDWFEKDIG